jgi:hypothetical protein
MIMPENTFLGFTTSREYPGVERRITFLIEKKNNKSPLNIPTHKKG